MLKIKQLGGYWRLWDGETYINVRYGEKFVMEIVEN